jgi:hypothetical protein
MLTCVRDGKSVAICNPRYADDVAHRTTARHWNEELSASDWQKTANAFCGRPGSVGCMLAVMHIRLILAHSFKMSANLAEEFHWLVFTLSIGEDRNDQSWLIGIRHWTFSAKLFEIYPTDEWVRWSEGRRVAWNVIVLRQGLKGELCETRACERSDHGCWDGLPGGLFLSRDTDRHKIALGPNSDTQSFRVFLDGYAREWNVVNSDTIWMQMLISQNVEEAEDIRQMRRDYHFFS